MFYLRHIWSRETPIRYGRYVDDSHIGINFLKIKKQLPIMYANMVI